jgi:hypothetical protein
MCSLARARTIGWGGGGGCARKKNPWGVNPVHGVKDEWVAMPQVTMSGGCVRVQPRKGPGRRGGKSARQKKNPWGVKTCPMVKAKKHWYRGHVIEEKPDKVKVGKPSHASAS